jgi:hypothetical protein
MVLMIESGTFFAQNSVTCNIRLHRLFTVYEYMKRIQNGKLL